MKIDLLENLGLTKTEIKVYVTLLELNTAPVSEIAERCGVYRKNVYDSLSKLVKKGLVSFANVERRKVFRAEDPKHLVDFIDFRKKEIQSLLPHLKAIYKAPPVMDDVMVYKGKEGIKMILENVMETKKDYDLFGAGEKFKDFLPHYYSQYQKRKRENNIKCRAIHSENERHEEFVQEFIGDVRFLPKEFINSSTTRIYGNKIAIIIWKENPFGIIINSSEVAESYKYYFELLWASANK